MTDRAHLPEVRNPLLALPSAQEIHALPVESRMLLHALLKDLAADARIRAQDSWKRNKGPMALYWKSVSVYAGHLSRLLKKGGGWRHG